MKNIIKSLLFVLVSFSFFACDPQDNDDHNLGEIIPITDDQVSYTKVVSDKSPNVFTFTNTTESKTPYSILWDFGNNSTSKNKSATASYSYAGEYTVTLTIYTADGGTAQKSEVLVIKEDDPSLLASKAFVDLTGGMEKPEGTTWVIDQFNNYTAEVAGATGFGITGHMGLGPLNSYGQEWWGAAANAKSGWSLYSSKFTFIQDGLKLNIANEGVGYGRFATYKQGGYTLIEQQAEDAVFKYDGGDYTFAIEESGEYPVLTLSGNAFLGYYCGTQDYEIIYQTGDVLALRTANPTEGQDWVLVYCREELNIGKRPAAKALSEDFEGQKLSVAFSPTDLGERTGVANNYLAYDALNSSQKAFAYEKAEKKVGSLSYVTPDYTFDLKKQNKVRMQVLIPAATINAGLEAKVVVKLQDSMTSDPTATEAKKEMTLSTGELDKWVAVEFDFSDSAAVESFDKIVIQFGGEGDQKGIFYFDNFQLIEK